MCGSVRNKEDFEVKNGERKVDKKQKKKKIREKSTGIYEELKWHLFETLMRRN